MSRIKRGISFFNSSWLSLLFLFVFTFKCEALQELSMKKTAQYGTWKSPITTDLVTQGTKRFSNVVIDGNDVYWDEMRPLGRRWPNRFVRHLPE